MLQPMAYDGFRLFMETYLEASLPEELIRHLFLSFLKRPLALARPVMGKDGLIKEVAASASHTVCAPVVQQAASELRTSGAAAAAAGGAAAGGAAAGGGGGEGEKHGIAERLQGLSEKLHSLSHGSSGGGGGGGGGESGNRSRAGEWGWGVGGEEEERAKG